MFIIKREAPVVKKKVGFEEDKIEKLDADED
jgi:hypothetical protein